jgi:tetratricopeptide (TPR) repeat protein
MKVPPVRRAPRSRSAAWLILFVWLSACGPSDPLAEPRQRQAEGDFASTLEPLRELVDLQPDSAEVYYLYGQALAATGQTSLAEWPLRKAMEDPQWLVPAGLRLAVGALETGNFQSAIDVTTRLLEATPDNVQVLLLRANAYSHSRLHPELALADVDRVLELDPDATDALQPRIVALIELDRIDDAKKAIEDLGARIDATELGPGARGWHCATTALFVSEGGNVELARKQWEECLERFADQPNVLENAIQFYDEQGELERSIELLRGALAKSPTSRGYRMAAAERLRLVGRREEALALLEEGTTAESPQLAAVAWTDLAAFHSADGDTEAEAKAARRALELARSVGRPHPELLLVYADAVLRAGDLEEALAIADEIEVPAYRRLLQGRVAQARDRPAEAIEHYEETFRVWPDNAFARYYAALAYEALGDFERAVDAYRYSIRIAPGLTDARLRVARLLAAQGGLREAFGLLNLRRRDQPPTLEGELLSLRLAARLGDTQELQNLLGRFRRGLPEQLGLAAAHAAEGLSGRLGPAAALRALRGYEGLDLRDPRHADALRAVVLFSRPVGQLDAARADVRAALARHPEAAAFHEIEGLLLELEGRASAGEIRAAYERALAIDPEQPHALAGRARLALSADPAGALADFERVARSQTADATLRADAMKGAAEALLALDRAEEAEARLRALLHDYPYDARAAAKLAEIELRRGSPSDRTLELAKRAVHFGGGAPALELLARVHQQRGEPERATEAADRARQLREGRAPAPEGNDPPGGTG